MAKKKGAKKAARKAASKGRKPAKKGGAKRAAKKGAKRAAKKGAKAAKKGAKKGAKKKGAAKKGGAKKGGGRKAARKTAAKKPSASPSAGSGSSGKDGGSDAPSGLRRPTAESQPAAVGEMLRGRQVESARGGSATTRARVPASARASGVGQAAGVDEKPKTPTARATPAASVPPVRRRALVEQVPAGQVSVGQVPAGLAPVGESRAGAPRAPDAGEVGVRLPDGKHGGPFRRSPLGRSASTAEVEVSSDGSKLAPGPPEVPVVSLRRVHGPAPKESVLDANKAFYQALEDRDIGALTRLWVNDETVRCTQPNGVMQRGWEEVRRAFEGLFSADRPHRIDLTQVSAEESDGLAYVSLVEQVAMPQSSRPRREHVATNQFRNVDGRWRMVNHHVT